MSASYTSNRIIRSVQRTAVVPISQSTFTEQDILEIASEEIDISVVPQILKLHEDYLLASEEVPADGRKAYDIPYRAIGSKLRDVAWVDNNGNTYEMTKVPVDFLSDYNNNAGSTAEAQYYYIKNNQIWLINNLATSGSFKFFYYFRPNRLVKDERAGVIKSIDRDNNLIVVDSIPEHFNEGLVVDFIQSRTPHRTLGFDLTVNTVNFSSGEITVNTLPEDLRVGDYIAQAEESPVPQIPSEIHPVLVQRIAFRINESLGDAQASGMSKARLGEMDTNAQSIIDNRVEASPAKIINRNGFISQVITRRRHGGRY